MPDRRTLAVAGVLALVATVIAGGSARAVAAPDIKLTETIAAEGDTVGFTGQSDFGGPSGCEVQVAGETAGSFDCSVEIKR